MTVLTSGDIAIVHASADGMDLFSFVLQRDIDVGTVINFTDNGWRAAGGFRSGEGTVTYTASAAMAAGSVITLSGLDLDAAGDQIIAYQGDAATPTILYLVDFADGNNTVAGDATDANTTALPPGFTLGVNAVAVGFDNAIYAGPIDGSPPQLFPLISNSANWIDGNALLPSFRYFYPAHLDLDANNSTSGGVDYRAEVTNDSAPVPISDTDSDIDDFDGVIITFAQITINNPFPGDVLSVIGTLPFGIIATPFDPFTGTLSLIGFGSHSAYETAIEQIGFSTDAPVGVTKSISVWVFDDFWWSNEAHAIFTVTSAGEPPDLDLDANNSTGFGVDAVATYAAGSAAVPVTDTDVLITDDGTTIQSATINILDYSLHQGDTLSIAGTLPTGITASSYNAFTGIITLSGSASLAAYQTALRQVVFSSTLAFPSTQNRDIQVSVNDGIFESNFATMHMHVVIPPPNVTPVLDLDFNNSTTSGSNYLTGFTESVPPVPVAIVDTDVRVIDGDDPNLASATITLANPQAGDHLTFEGTPPAGILVFGSGTNLITLTGVALQGNYELALRQVRYSNDSADPSNVTRTIEIVVNDGTINSNTATALVQVEAVNNSAPVIDLDPDDSTGTARTTFRTIFTENGTPTAIADTDVTIADLDSTTLFSATIKLQNPQAGDLLTVTLPLPGIIVASAYDPATGVLTLSGEATLDDYEVALQQIRYNNTSDNPATVDRLIEVVVSDGVNTSNVAAAVITVVAVNDAPVLTVDFSAAYVENDGPIGLSPLATITDLDDTELSQAVVTITDGMNTDRLTINGVTGGNVDGILFIYETASHAMVLTGASSLLNYRDLLQRLGFESLSDNPTDFGARPTRTLTWTVSDGEAVTTATTTLNIVAVNDAPQATVAATASYTENAAPVVLSPASTATDVDNTTLVSGEVRIASTAVDGDLLTVNGLQSGTFGGIAFSYDAVLHDLMFTGPTTVADYQAFLQAVAFSSTSDNPTDSGLTPTRTLAWFVSDGDALSAVQTTVVSITAVADPPVNTVPGAQSVNEDTTLAITGVSVADPDSSTLTTTLTVLNGRLHVTAGTGVSNNDTGSVTISGTIADINAALAGLSYTGNLNFNGSDTLTITTGDGTAQDIDTVAITVNPVNDAPVAQNGSASGNEDTPIIGTLVATDVDGPALTYALGAQAANGTVVVNTDGSYTYTPNLNFNGTDSFTFTASDGTAGSNTATVTLTVAAVNDAPVAQNGSASGNEDTPINGTLVATDVESPVLTYALGAQATNGTVVVNTDGSYTYAPNPNFNGTDSFTFTASDGTAGSNTATVTLTVAAVNDAPVAQNGSASGNEDTPIIGTLVATDVDNPTLTYTLGAQATNGTVVVNTDGTYTYTPNLNFNGSDSFTFTASDGTIVSNAATVTLTVAAVNDAPVAQNGSASGSEDTPINGTLVATDVDNLTLTYALGAQAANGTVVVNTDGSYTYTPNLNFNGTDSFTFTASDGTIVSNAATVTLTVAAVNDAPVNTVPGAQTAQEDTPLLIPGLSVADVDSPSLTVTVSALNGSVAIVPGLALLAGNLSDTVTISGTLAEVNLALASVYYLGDPNFFGPDTLTMTSSDGALSDSDPVAITVAAVADAPVLDLDANNSSGAPGSGYVTTFTENGPPVALTDIDLVLDDVDSDNLVGATFVLLNARAGDVLVVNGTLPDGILASFVGNKLTLTGDALVADYAAALALIAFNNPGEAPDPQDRLILVTVDDGTLTTSAFTLVHLTVTNDAPVAQDGSASGNEDTPIIGTLVAIDPDGPTLTYTLGAQATNGTVVVNTDGSYTYTPNLNFNGTDSFTFTASDGTIVSNAATVTLTVTAVNDAPVAQNGSASGNEDTPIGGTLVATDVESPVLTYALGAQAANGTVVVNTDGSYTYTPNPNFNGTDSFTFTASDGTIGSNTATVTLTVAAVNDAPVAQNGSASGNEDTPINGTLVATDVESPTLTYTLGAQATNGTVVVNTDGSYTYTPNPNFNGTDSFTFTASDGTAGSNTATVTLTVAAVNDTPVAQNGSASGNEDTPITGTLVATDVESPTLTYTLGAQAANGTVVVNSDGTYTYTPNLNFNGTDSFTFTANDGSVDSNTATITLTVNPVNDAPVAQNGSASGNEDTPITGTLVATDVESLTLTYTLGTQAANGTVVVNSDGTYTYTPNLNFNGSDSFTFTANDGAAVSNTATITLTVNPVNDAPVAQNGSASGSEDTPIGGTLVAIDPDGPTLTYTLGAQATNGTVVVNTDGSYTYTPNPNFNGSDSFTFTASDGTVGSNTATVTLTVAAVNDAPVAQNGSASGNEDTPINGTLVATDVDNLTLTYALGAQATNGTVVVNSDGSYTYTPNLNFNGTDSFTFTASDGTVGSNAATVTLTVAAVNDAPVNTVPGPQTAQEDTPLLITGLSVVDVDSPTLTVTLSALNGSVAVVPGLALIAGNLTGTATITGTLAEVNLALASVYYQGNPNFFGPDTLTMTSSDGALSDSDPVAITVAAVADAPVLDLDADNSSGAPGSGYQTTFTENGPAVALTDADLLLTDDGTNLVGATFLLLNAQAGDALIVNGSLPAGITADFTGNQLTLSGSASVANYRAALALIAFTNPGEAPDPQDRLIQVTVDDGTLTTSAFTLVHVTVTNDAPVAQDGSASGNEDTPIGGTLVATDVDNLTLTYTLGAQATNGTVVVNTDGSYTYTPNLNFNGSDSFTFTASDGTAGSNTATVTLTVAAVNDAPVAQNGSASGNEDTPINGTLVATDVDNLTLTYALGAQAANGIVVVNTDGSYTYTPNLNFNGTDSFTFTASDGTVGSNAATVTLTVAAVNDAPVNTVPGPQTAQEDTPLLITGLSVVDVDSPTLTVTLSALNGSVAVVPGLALIAGNLTGTATITGTLAEVNLALASVYYQGNPNFFGPDTLTMTSSDGALSDSDPVAITVAAVADAPVLDLDADNSSGAPGSGYQTTFTENGPAVALTDADLLLTDDGTNLVGATFLLLNAQAGDALIVNGSLPAGITADFTGNQLTLSGSASVANYRAALALIAFTNPGEAPDPQDRLIQVTVDDGTLTTSAFTLVHVTVTNDAPVAQDGSASGNEDTPIIGTLVATDVDNLTLTYTLGAQATNGTVVVNTDGSYTYTPNLNFNGSDSFTFTASDGTAGSNTATVTLTVAAVNDAPVAQNGSASGNEDTPINGTLVATDVESPVLTYALGAQAANGTVVVNTDGSYTYTPNLNFNGTDSFTFTANDGSVTSNTATVTLTVAAVNDAPVAQNGSASGNEDTLISGTLVATDVESPTLTYTLGAQAANGTVVVNTDGTYTYTPNLNFNGTDSFTFTASDGTLGSNTATVTLTVNPVNDAPVAQNGSASGNEDTQIIGTLVATDVDNLTLTYTLGAQAANGSVVVNTDGTYTYTPNLNFNGTDSFTFTASDGTLGSNTATVTLTVNPVNDAPVAQNGSASGNEDTQIGGTLVATDVDNLTLIYTLGAQAANGTVVVNTDGTYTYTPNLNFNGTDSFTFTASDGTVGSNTATVTLTVNPVNDAPVAQNGSASGNEDTQIGGILVATDVDGPALTYALGAQAANGSVVVNTDGSYTYTPNPNFNGTDSFTFTASDGTAGSNTATVTLTVAAVNDAPVAQDGSANGSEDTPINGTLVATDAEGQALTYALGAQAANGTVVVNTDGSYTYTPNPNFNGTDSFTFTASDGTAGSNTATVTLTVAAVNDAPVAQDGSANGSEDTPINGTLVATDVDNLTLTYALGIQATNGTVVVNAGGSYTYTPNPDFHGSDSFTFTANDGAGGSDTGTITLTVSAVNDAPVAQDGSASGSEDTPISGTVVATDVDSPTLNYVLGAQALHGTVVVNPNGSYTYTPNPDFNGTDSFTFTANDGAAGFDTATVTLTVNPVNDAPVAQDASASGAEDTPISGTVVATDVDGPALTYALGVQAAHGTVVVNTNGSYTYTPNLNFNGSDSFTFTANDGAGGSDTATVTLTVNPVNDAPVNTVPGPQSAVEDTPLLIAGLSVADDSPTLTVTLSVLNGSVAIVPGLALLAGNLSDTVTITGTLAEVNLALASTYYLGNPNFFGPDTLTIATSDGALSDSDTVAIEVADTIEAPDLDLDAGTPGSGYVTTFTENGLPVALTDTDLVLADDSSTLVSATFLLLNAQAGDALVVTGPLPGTISPIITGNQITLSGPASVADFTAAMKLIAFTNPGDAPAPQDRLIEVTVNDGTSTTSAFTLVHMAVTNDAPVAQNGSASGNEDTPIVGTVVATDPDGPALTYALAVQALHGTVVVQTNGSYIYTPSLDYNGGDSFTFTVNDGAGSSDTATVTLTVNAVNDAPVAQDGSASGNEDTPISGTVVATDVDSLTLTYALGAQAANGTVVVNADGTYTYTPKPNFNGTDSFTFTANDGAGGSDTATITLTVNPVNDAPVAQFGDGAVDEDTTLNGALVATDVDGQAVTYALVTQALHGTVVVNPDGTGSYTPDPDFNGSDSFTYSASDGTAGSNIATVTMTVNPVNDPPVNTVPGPQSAEPGIDTPITGLAIDDIDAGSNIIQTVLSVSHGTLVVTPSGGAAVAGNGTNTVVVTGSLPGINATLAATGLVVYRSAAGFVGTDMLVITTTDDANASDTDAVAINVGGQAPTGIVLSGTAINEFSPDGTLVGSLAAIDPDPGDTFTFALLDDAGARFAIDGTSLIVRHGLLLDFEQAAAHAITIEVTDSSGGRFQQGFTIGIANVDPEIITQSSELSGSALASAAGGTTIVGGPLDDRISLAGGNDTIDAGAGNDFVVGGPGNDHLTGAAGDDTTAFTALLGSTTPDDFGQWIDIAGADGSDRLFTIEHLQFPDGTVHVNDGDLLFDTLFYDHRNLDVFHAAANAGEHYAVFGWHEGRDPNAFFSTTGYLSAYHDVATAGPPANALTVPEGGGGETGGGGTSIPDSGGAGSGGGGSGGGGGGGGGGDGGGGGGGGDGTPINPLEHYRDIGWREGRDPSLLFDTTLYLIHNPDVAAAGVNPLEHFLQFGRAEGRAAYGSIGQDIGMWGFDAEFYLMSNPDVAAAGVDPLQHYVEFGWHEGRNPNRYFDTAGYLARYTDVAAAGVNPLEHYDAFGWREGRDPAGAFDTRNYLAASPDVAAANVNPLVHFLEFGIYELRDPFADGVLR